MDTSKVRKKMGRPRKPDAATTLVSVQLSKATAKDLDRWAKDSGIGSRSGAARALIEHGLASAKKPAKRKKTQDWVKAAADRAGARSKNRVD
jgi:metal-responsive CopG/Arc/MetJ family transcriptional regulator